MDASLANENTCNVDQGIGDTNPQSLLTKETWSQVVQKSIDANKPKKVNDDRCILEH
jgi:hypothetical protein